MLAGGANEGDIAKAIDDPEDDHVRAFLRLWMNEHEAPGLLPYAADSVEVIGQLLDNQSAILEALPRSPDAAFRARLCQMEMARLSFQLASYHRCRLLKITRNAYYYSQYRRQLMSPAERAFLDAFRAAFESELRERVLEGFPEAERLFPERRLLAASAHPGDAIVDQSPEDASHVVVRVLQDAPQTLIDPGAPHDLQDLLPGDVILLQYSSAKGLLLDEKAACI